MKKYKFMSKSQLKQYLLNNRHDREALKELKSRPKQNVITIAADLPIDERERILRQAVEEKK